MPMKATPFTHLFIAFVSKDKHKLSQTEQSWQQFWEVKDSQIVLILCSLKTDTDAPLKQTQMPLTMELCTDKPPVS